MESTRTKLDLDLLMAALPVAVDAVAALLIIFWLAPLTARLQEPSGLNALLVVLLYILFCFGVYLSRKLLPRPGSARWAPPEWFQNPKVRGAFGLVFAFFMATTFAYQLGYFEAIFQLRAGLLEEGSTAAFLVYAPGSWIGFSLLVILVLAFPVDSNLEPGNLLYVILAALSLIAVDSLLVFTTAQAQAMIRSLAFPNGVLLWLAVLAAFTLSLLPARAIYQSRQPYLSGWLSFAGLLLVASVTAVFT